MHSVNESLFCEACPLNNSNNNNNINNNNTSTEGLKIIIMDLYCACRSEDTEARKESNETETPHCYYFAYYKINSLLRITKPTCETM